MNLETAIAKAEQILTEECVSPTVLYDLRPLAEDANPVVQVAHVLTGLTAPQRWRQVSSDRPLRVLENPAQWMLRSTNYDLLCALPSQVDSDSRDAFTNHVLLKIQSKSTCSAAKSSLSLTHWMGLVSTAPLIAEFGIRHGATLTFLNVLAEQVESPVHVILLLHLDLMIALNFTVFTDAEYVRLSHSISTFVSVTEYRFQQQIRVKTGKWAGVEIELRLLLDGIVQAGDRILEGCRQARYFYLKKSLESGLNLEINQDMETVQTYLQTLGFSKTLARSLHEADHLYQDAENEFDLKSSMAHLRSFLEGLHTEALPSLQTKFGGNLPRRWGDGLTYLRNYQIFSKTEEAYVSSLYTLISDEGVHPLVAEREYSRLFRNVVIEYALLFLRKIEKLGLSLAAGQT